MDSDPLTSMEPVPKAMALIAFMIACTYITHHITHMLRGIDRPANRCLQLATLCIAITLVATLTTTTGINNWLGTCAKYLFSSVLDTWWTMLATYILGGCSLMVAVSFGCRYVFFTISLPIPGLGLFRRKKGQPDKKDDAATDSPAQADTNNDEDDTEARERGLHLLGFIICTLCASACLPLLGDSQSWLTTHIAVGAWNLLQQRFIDIQLALS